VPVCYTDFSISCLQVTDAPEIHSQGYHVKFDLAQGPLGFILPEWTPSPCPPPSNSLSLCPPVRWNTRIELPIKASLQGEHVAAKFSDIHPSLLLFLQRLQRLALADVISPQRRRTVVMDRRDLPQEGLVQVIVETRVKTEPTTRFETLGKEATNSLQTSVESPGLADEHTIEPGAITPTFVEEVTTSLQTWLVNRTVLKAAVARNGIASTEVALAFPLQKIPTGGWETVANEPQQVFAFLPLRSYGLRFLAQADFLVPSSREDVDHDSGWNQWLRGEIAAALVAALPAFKKLFAGRKNVDSAGELERESSAGELEKGQRESLTSAEGGPNESRNSATGAEAEEGLGRALGVNAFLGFVPLEGEVLGFFAPLPRLVLQKLRALHCLPVEGSPGREALPCQVRVLGLRCLL
jgi:hypothetical protein